MAKTRMPLKISIINAVMTNQSISLSLRMCNESEPKDYYRNNNSYHKTRPVYLLFEKLLNNSRSKNQFTNIRQIFCNKLAPPRCKHRKP